jgi:hypothetical protein
MGGFVKPFLYMGGNFLKMLWRAFVSMVRKAASAFQVEARVQESPPEHVQGDSPVAEFIAANDSPDAKSAVEDAAKDAAKNMANLVSQLTGKAVDKERLLRPDGLAYAALNLQALGDAMVETRTNLFAADEALDAAALTAAHACGASQQSMRHLLSDCDFNSPLFAQFIPDEVQALARHRAGLWSQLCKLQLQFCDFAIQSVRVANESGLPDLENLSRTKMHQFADKEMSDLFSEQTSAQSELAASEKIVNPGFLNIKSQKPISSVSPVVDDDAPPSPVPSVSRRRWVGVSAGVVDHVENDEGSAHFAGPRER